MVYDDAWDMPKIGWIQQGSFEIPEIPPAYEPDAEPLVCLPAINQYWLPYVMGALDQLRNPSSWLVADDDAMYTTLARVSKLRDMIGKRADCGGPMIRFDGGTCQLQESTDGGTTWTEVTGWTDFAACLPPQTLLRFTEGCELQDSLDGGATYTTVSGWGASFGLCVQSNVPIIGLPPNPGDQSPSQLACSIASYVANQIILEAMQAAVTTVNDDLTLLSLAVSITNIIPEFVLVHLGVDAIATIYGFIAEGTLSDYEAAIADGTLWLEVSCAVYLAILGTGYVTPGDFAAIITNVSGITYAHPGVITAIVGYLNSLGAVGLAQLSQRAGLEVGADCSSCGWCLFVNLADFDGGFASDSVNGSGAVYTAGVGWEQVTVSNVTGTYIILVLSGPFTVNAISFHCTVGGPGTTSIIATSLAGTFNFAYSQGIVDGANFIHTDVGVSCDTLYLQVGNSISSTGGTSAITDVTIQGTGDEPTLADWTEC